MKRYGEINRYNYNNVLYILSSRRVYNPHDKDTLECVDFCFQISTKTSKKLRDKNMSKQNRKFSLVKNNENAYTLLKIVIEDVKNYITIFKPLYICLGFYGEYKRERLKREKTYSYVMKSLGYDIFQRVEEDCHNYYKRILL
jgi:hypothetical protein